ncbi:hypothetical protein RM96_07625 [Cupriavidus sp. IDO]|nr:hypothetical protein RM96_07625 [Cupriavidus sp. IDO]
MCRRATEGARQPFAAAALQAGDSAWLSGETGHGWRDACGFPYRREVCLVVLALTRAGVAWAWRFPLMAIQLKGICR